MHKLFALLFCTTLFFSRSYGQLHVSTGTDKYVLLEEATGIWQGFSPDAQQDIIQSVQPIPRAIVISWHGSDSLTIPGDPFASYVSGYPQATVDRAVIGGSSSLDRPWESAVSARAAATPNFKVDMTTSYNASTRVMTVTVTGEALLSLTGKWNINAFIAEDSISSAPAGYQQQNYLTTLTTACNGRPCWWTGLSSPLPSSRYSHMNVARAILAAGGNICGDSAFFNPNAGTTATKVYTYTLPSSWDASHVFVIGLVQKNNITGDGVIENAVSTKRSPPGPFAAFSDSIIAYTSKICGMSEFYIATHSYRTGLTIHTDFGDGLNNTATVLASYSGGYVDITHSYAAAGTYTIKHVLYDGTTAVDSVTYSHSYLLCKQFPVMLYYDANSNCVKDGMELFLRTPSMVRVDSNGVTIDSISSTAGFYYQAYGSAGDVYTFTVTTPPAGLAITCPATASVTDTIGIDTAATRYFAFSCTTGTIYDLRLFTVGRMGSHAYWVDILCDNPYCYSVPSTVTAHITPRIGYFDCYPTPGSSVGGTLTWNIPSLSPITYPFNIRIRGEVAGSSLRPGDTVHSDFHLSPLSGDADTSNNDCNREDTSFYGWDPNFMEVSPAGYISAGTTLQYAIEFENTGNDTAFNIYVMDTLSDNVDIASLRLVTSTAAMFTSKMKDGAGHNVMKFDFPHINLLDSSHHGQCTGMLIFTVNAKAGLPDGTTIFNHAGIFFDDNPVVLTNTVENIIGSPTRIIKITKNAVASIFPNPATDELTVKTTQGAYSSLSLSNSMGTVVLQQNIQSEITKVDVKALPAGIYYVTLKGDNGVEIKKFVKE